MQETWEKLCHDHRTKMPLINIWPCWHTLLYFRYWSTSVYFVDINCILIFYASILSMIQLKLVIEFWWRNSAEGKFSPVLRSVNFRFQSKGSFIKLSNTKCSAGKLLWWIVTWWMYNKLRQPDVKIQKNNTKNRVIMYLPTRQYFEISVANSMLGPNHTFQESKLNSCHQISKVIFCCWNSCEFYSLDSTFKIKKIFLFQDWECHFKSQVVSDLCKPVCFRSFCVIHLFLKIGSYKPWLCPQCFPFFFKTAMYVLHHV